MRRTLISTTVPGLLLAAASLLLAPAASAQEVRGRLFDHNGEFQCRPIDYGSPDLFYNFYADSTCSQTGANLYISPRPVPAYVGHTYITYQPLMPHEFLYPHHHSYQRYYDGGRGMTRAKVSYYYPPVRTAVVGAIHHFKIPR
jgi:hypothetical protein